MSAPVDIIPRAVLALIAHHMEKGTTGNLRINMKEGNILGVWEEAYHVIESKREHARRSREGQGRETLR